MTLRQVSNCKPVVLTTQLQPVVLQEGSLAPKTEPSVLPCAIPALGSAWEQPKLLAWTQTALLEAPVSEVPVRAPHPRLGPKMVCEHWREIRTRANPHAYIVMRHSFHSVTPSIKLALCHRACVFNYFSRLLPCSWCLLGGSISIPAFFLEDTSALCPLQDIGKQRWRKAITGGPV